MPAEQKPSFPTWLMPLLSLVLGIIGSLVTFSYKYGALEGNVKRNTEKIDALSTDYYADKAKREAEAAARLASYEQARAAKLAEMEAQIDRLKTLPASRP